MFKYGNADKEYYDSGASWIPYIELFAGMSNDKGDYTIYPDEGGYLQQDYLLMKKLNFVRGIKKSVMHEMMNKK